MKRLVRLAVRRRSTRPMACAEVAELVQCFLDGRLSEAQMARISAHLEDCRRCGLEADTYRQIKAALAARRGEVPPESLERLRLFGQSLARS